MGDNYGVADVFNAAIEFYGMEEVGRMCGDVDKAKICNVRSGNQGIKLSQIDALLKAEGYVIIKAEKLQKYKERDQKYRDHLIMTVDLLK